MKKGSYLKTNNVLIKNYQPFKVMKIYLFLLPVGIANKMKIFRYISFFCV